MRAIIDGIDASAITGHTFLKLESYIFLLFPIEGTGFVLSPAGYHDNFITAVGQKPDTLRQRRQKLYIINGCAANILHFSAVPINKYCFIHSTQSRRQDKYRTLGLYLTGDYRLFNPDFYNPSSEAMK
jgi:hypothetical protein